MRNCFLLIALALPLLAAATDQKKKYEFDIKGTDVWTDSGIDVKAGDSLQITATGTLQFPQAKPATPEGLPRGWTDLIRIMPDNESGRGALLGRLGNSEGAVPFLIGEKRNWQPIRDGRLYLGINRPSTDSPTGSFHVTVEFLSHANPSTAAAAAKNQHLPVFTQAMLDSLPGRVTDAQGNAGDRVNFVIVGSEESMKQALDAAGWVIANRTAKDAVVQGALASFSKKAYTQLPMSELQLYGRPQDYGYAHADPLAVVASRHHFRIWKAPFTVDGQTAWIGAGTHDIGFDRDRRNNGITHKIDPEVDKEREFIADSLNETGLVAKVDYMTPKNPLTEAKTATGAGFKSDGRTLVITLTSSNLDDSVKFSSLFCNVLAENPDGGTWKDCGNYYAGATAAQPSTLGALSTAYRLLIIPGILNTCASSAPAFEEGQVHLRDKHNVTVELLAVPNDTSESNAKMIADYLTEHMKTDKRKYIVLGYSKGAPDVQVALANYPDVVSSVAAFVTVAGAVGGSPIADIMPSMVDKWLSKYGTVACKGDLAQGFKSLKSEIRKDFLAENPKPPVPSYSIAATSDKTNTSKMLMQTWQILLSYGSSEDGQLLKEDAIVPGAKYLGDARGDHFSVGLPFAKNDFPRGALLESIYRYVTQDLGAVAAPADPNPSPDPDPVVKF